MDALCMGTTTVVSWPGILDPDERCEAVDNWKFFLTFSLSLSLRECLRPNNRKDSKWNEWNRETQTAKGRPSSIAQNKSNIVQYCIHARARVRGSYIRI